MVSYQINCHFSTEPFLSVFGPDARLPAVRDRPEQVDNLPSVPGERAWCWLIDVWDDAIDPITFDRLILALAARWEVPPALVSYQIKDVGGVYILACACWNPWVPVPCVDGGSCRASQN